MNASAQERNARVKTVRLVSGMTQREFAEKIGVTFQAVNHWEKGRCAPTRKTLQNIIEKFSMQTINVEDDPVKHPAHYTSGRIEVLDAIEEWDLTYGIGNVVKYCARAGKKTDDKLQDLCKAKFYLDREIEKLQRDRLEGRSFKAKDTVVMSDGRGGVFEMNKSHEKNLRELRGGQ